MRMFALWVESVPNRPLQSGLLNLEDAIPNREIKDVDAPWRIQTILVPTRLLNHPTALERAQILIVSGPPGMGKTTLAKMVAYQD